jgi:hypothetical protein
MTVQIGMFLFPKITQLDLTAPFEVLSRRASPELVQLVRQRLAPSWRDYAARLPER